MSTFDSAQHPRRGDGRFSSKQHGDADVSLASSGPIRIGAPAFTGKQLDRARELLDAWRKQSAASERDPRSMARLVNTADGRLWSRNLTRFDTRVREMLEASGIDRSDAWRLKSVFADAARNSQGDERAFLAELAANDIHLDG